MHWVVLCVYRCVSVFVCCLVGHEATVAQLIGPVFFFFWTRREVGVWLMHVGHDLQ